ISKSELASLKSRCVAVELILFDQGVEVDLNLGSVLVGIDLEITKLATLATERNVNIETERIVDASRFFQRRDCFADELRFPLRKGWIVRDEVVADFGACFGIFRCHSLLL